MVCVRRPRRRGGSGTAIPGPERLGHGSGGVRRRIRSDDVVPGFPGDRSGHASVGWGGAGSDGKAADPWALAGQWNHHLGDQGFREGLGGGLRERGDSPSGGTPSGQAGKSLPGEVAPCPKGREERGNLEGETGAGCSIQAERRGLQGRRRTAWGGQFLRGVTGGMRGHFATWGSVCGRFLNKPAVQWPSIPSRAMVESPSA